MPLLAALRPAVFGLEVLAARSRGEERADYESVLEEVAARLDELRAVNPSLILASLTLRRRTP